MKEQFEEDNFVFVEEEHRSPEIITIDSDSEYIADDNDDVICLDDDVVLLNDDDDKPQVLPNPAKDPHQAQPAAISASKAAQTSQNIKTANSGTFVNKTPSNEAPSLEHLNDRQIPELKNYHHRHRFQCTEAREEAGDDDMTCLNDKNNDAEQQLNHPPSLPIFFCRPCLDPFTTVNALRYHHREHHHGIKPYRCAFPDCTEPGPFSRQETAKKHIASQHGHRNVQQKYVAVDRFLLAEEKRALFSWLHSEEHRQCVEEYMSCKAENESAAAAEVEELADERFVSGPSGQLPSHTDYLAMTPEPPEASATVEEAATTNQPLPMFA
ncbi:PREDICTED: uncharacterized protein LOC108381363 [Rhagoletis zephyria]|uniref:uncharacterized protein LOC108381363 n=1 Tax=Rhagoletis zephyria TaxID=28612 RepID=UPI000811799F|nr:PREDICTED: uncharacterized protein LOC108381363 [Rhagoletis zephyria]